MKITILFLFLTISVMTINSQLISSGFKRDLYSAILQENRELWIYLPDSYNDSINAPEDYPVLYLLDGNWFFHSQVAVQEALTGGYYNYMPEMIIVGIVNTDRTRDLTPTKGQLIHNDKILYQNSGGADKFLQYLTTELKPFIEKEYRTNGFNMLQGHSFGGLFTIYTLLTKPKQFNAYIAHDPSLWWDNKYVYHLAEKKLNEQNIKGCSLYMSQANADTTETDKEEHTETIRMFGENILNKQSILRCEWEFYKNEDHGTIFLPASYAAMKYIFEGIRLPVKKIPEHPQLIEDSYKKVSEITGFKFIPNQKTIINMINYCKQMEQHNSMDYLICYLNQLYPENKHWKKHGELD